MINKCWNEMYQYFHNMDIDNYVIMPNHFHALIEIKRPVDNNDVGVPLVGTQLQRNLVESSTDVIYNIQPFVRADLCVCPDSYLFLAYFHTIKKAAELIDSFKYFKLFLESEIHFRSKLFTNSFNLVLSFRCSFSFKEFLSISVISHEVSSEFTILDIF